VDNLANLIPQERIEKKIYLLRGQKVMLDRDLAALYKVKTMRLNEQVKRNIKRFPSDFMFQLTKKEMNSLISQIAISKGRGGTRKAPYAFTENGVAMLSSVLNSDRAIQVNIQIMRAFTRIRELLNTHKDLAHKLDDLERKVQKHDMDINMVFQVIKQLMAPPKSKMKKIGF
jgi:hypothetical protein